MPEHNKRNVYFKNNDVWRGLEELAGEDSTVNRVLERLAKEELQKKGIKIKPLKKKS